jgi:hypothetical protein
MAVVTTVAVAVAAAGVLTEEVPIQEDGSRCRPFDLVLDDDRGRPPVAVVVDNLS